MALRRDEHVHEGPSQRVERIEHFHEGGSPATNVNVGPAAPANSAATVVTRVVLVIFSVLEVMLLVRFVFKLTGANGAQALVAWLYAFTDPLTRPFQGIFPEPQGVTVVDIPALLSIVFLGLIGALIVALARAIAGRYVA